MSISTLDTVRFRVIPWEEPVQVCAHTNAQLLGEPGVDDVVEVELNTTTRELHIRDEMQVAISMRVWARLCED